MAWWQFLLIWSLWPITAAPHAIVEYFLIERLVRRTLDRLGPLVGEAIMEPLPHASPATVVRLLLGMSTATPRIIRTSDCGPRLGVTPSSGAPSVDSVRSCARSRRRCSDNGGTAMIDLGLTGKRAVVSGAGRIPGRAGHGTKVA